VDDLLPSAPEEIEGELSDAIRSRVKSELHPGERLLWASGSLPLMASPGVRTIITSLLALVLFTYAMASLSLLVQNPLGQIGPFITFGVISGIVCLCLVLGSFASWHQRRTDRARAAETFYDVTDRRAILWKPSYKKGAVEIHTIPRGKLVNVHRIEYADGHGDVIFSYQRVGNDEVGGWRPIGFEGVAEVRRVEELVRRILLDPGEVAQG
jgi:hypothetical protein